MTDDLQVCPHGYDKRYVVCNRCIDPAFDAARGPEGSIHTLSIGGSALYCVWVPEITARGRVSKMFHRTDCGQSGAPTIGAYATWKYCPYCGKQIHISKDALRLRA